jgi:hypothetical protein
MRLSRQGEKIKMEMQMNFIRKLPTPQELKAEFPLDQRLKDIKEQRDREIEAIFTGKDDRFLLIIGPCSADNEDAVLDYMNASGEGAGKGEGQNLHHSRASIRTSRGRSAPDIRECCISRIV